MRKLKTLTETAQIMGMHKQQIVSESKKPGYPKHTRDGRTMYDPEEVALFRKRTIRSRRKKHQANENAATDGKAREPVNTQDEPIKEISALEISRNTVSLVWRLVKENATQKIVSPMEIDALKKSLAELRQAESDYLEIEKNRGGLIERTTVRELVGMLASRAVQAMNRLENSIATEFSVWLADPSIATMPADERSRKVRDFMKKTCSEVRRAEAEDAEKLIDEARMI